MYQFIKRVLFSVGLFASISLQAQYSGVINVPNATFSSLAVLVDSLNAFGLNGALTVNLTAAQTAPTGGYILGNTGSALLTTLSATNTLTLNGGGNTITSFSGSRAGSITSGQNDAIFSLVGVDFVTIKRFNFTESASNTTNTLAMEAAVAIYNVASTAGSANGCQNILIDSNAVNFSNLSTNGFAFAIYAYQYNTTTSSSWSAGTADIHRSIFITNNTVNQVYGGVYYRGSTGAQGRALFVNNNILNNIGGGTASAYGGYFFYLDSSMVDNNAITIESTQGSATVYGLFWSTNCGGFIRAEGNTVLLQHNGNSQTVGIYGASILGAKTHFRKNKIQFGSFPAVTSAVFYGIWHTYGGGVANYDLTIDSNEVMNGVWPGTGTFYGISAGGSTTPVGNTLNVTNNIIKNINRTGTNGTTYPIYFTSTNS